MIKRTSILIFLGISLIIGIYFLNSIYIKNKSLKTVMNEEELVKEADVPNSTKEMMAKKINMDDDKDKLIKATYIDAELNTYSRDIILNYMSDFLNDIDNRFPIQCLRKSGAYYYSIHKSNRGGYMYILYEYDKSLDKYRVVDKALMYKPLTREDFNSIKVKKSTLADVFKIDPEINQFLYVESCETVHFLRDGGLMRIKYTNKSNNYVVTEMKYEEPRKRSVAKFLLPQDLPDNTHKKIDKNNLKQTTLELINLVNNQDDKDELIKSKYEFRCTDNSIAAFEFSKELPEGRSMEEINSKYKIECLRESGGYYYSIHKTGDGRYLYLLYGYNVNRNEFCVIDKAFLYRSIEKESFNKIKQNKSTFEDILKIDPNTVCEYINIRYESVTLLKNGDLVRISYKSKNGKEIVDNIVIRPPLSDKNVLRYVSAEDLPK